MTEPRGRAARFFEGFANAVLDRAVPRVREWLRSRFGPDADLGAIRVEGRDVHLDDARVPLAPRVEVLLARATFRIADGAGRPLSLHALEGELRVGDAFRAPVRFESRPDAPGDAWVSGTLHLVDATWPVVFGRGTSPLRGQVEVVVDSLRWSLARGVFGREGARIEVEADGDLDAPGLHRLGAARVVIEEARAGDLADATAALTGAQLGSALALLDDARASGVATWDERTGAAIDLTAKTSRSSLRLVCRVDPRGALDGTLEGRLALGEIAAALDVPTAVRPALDDLATCTARLSGDATAPIVEGSLRADAIRIRLGRKAFLPPHTTGPSTIAFTLRADRDAARVEADGAIALGSGRLEVRGSSPIRGGGARTARVTAVEIPGAWIAAALEGRALPSDARVSGALDLGDDGATGHVELRTAASHLRLEPLHLRGDALEDTRLRGALALEDAHASGLFPIAVRPSPRGILDLDLSIEGPRRAPRLVGAIRSPAIEIGFASRPAGPSFPLDGASAIVALDRAGLSLDRLEASAFGTVMRADARFAWGDADREPRPGLRLRFEDADAHLLATVARLGGDDVVEVEHGGPRRASFTIPRSTLLTGDLFFAQDGAIEGDVGVETAARTALVGRVAISKDGALDGTTLRGRLGMGDAITIGLLDGPIRPAPAAVARVEAHASGSTSAPSFAIDANADELPVSFPDAPAVPPLPLERVSTKLHLDRARLVVRSLGARLHGGELAVEALFTFGAALQARVRLGGVRVGDVSIDASRRAGAWIEGTAIATSTIERRDGTTTASGELRIDGPSYPGLAGLAPTLARHGVTMPPLVGAGPLRANLTYGPPGLRVDALSASLPGVAASGGAALGAGGALSGRLVVRVHRDLVRSSPLLGVPALFVDALTVPLAIEGTLSDPRVVPEPLRTLERTIAEPIGAIASAFEDLLGGGARRPAAVSADVDAILDRILDHDPASESLIAELVDRGVDPDDFSDLLERRRAARRR